MRSCCRRQGHTHGVLTAATRAQVYLLNTTVTCLHPPATSGQPSPFAPRAGVVDGVAAAAAVASVLGLLLVRACLRQTAAGMHANGSSLACTGVRRATAARSVRQQLQLGRWQGLQDPCTLQLQCPPQAAADLLRCNPRVMYQRSGLWAANVLKTLHNRTLHFSAPRRWPAGSLDLQAVGQAAPAARLP